MDEMDALDAHLSQTTPPAPPAESTDTDTATPVAVLERMPNAVIERARSALKKERLPASNVACNTCPLATWSLSGDRLRAHCGKMFMVTFDSDEPPELAITDCSGREQALLQLQ